MPVEYISGLYFYSADSSSNQNTSINEDQSSHRNSTITGPTVGAVKAMGDKHKRKANMNIKSDASIGILNLDENNLLILAILIQPEQWKRQGVQTVCSTY